MGGARSFGILEFWCLGNELNYLHKNPPELHTQCDGNLTRDILCTHILAMSGPRGQV